VVEGVQKVKTGARVNATQAAAEGEATPATAHLPRKGEKK